jgi:NDP-sugar pyrophosphorylase family protein
VIEPREMKTAVILAGGLGSRLRPYTITIPKPLLPVGGYPIIEIVIRQLAAQGFQRVIISTGYLGELIQAYVQDGERLGVAIEYIREAEPLGTAGPLRLIVDLPETFLVMNGDILTTLDFAGLMERTVAGEHDAGIAVSSRTVSIDYGVLHVDDTNCLVTYEEKPKLNYSVSMGVYVISRSAVDRIPAGRYDMPDLLQSLVAADGTVYCDVSSEYWCDVGRLDDFERANLDVEANPGRFVPDHEQPRV